MDKLVYFNLRARAEPIRMLYALAGKPLNDVRVHTPVDWLEIRNGKHDTYLYSLPVLSSFHRNQCLDSYI